MSHVVALVEDLLFLSRIREAAHAQGLEVRSVRSVPDLLRACAPPPRVVILDLDAPDLPAAEAVAALGADATLAAVPTVGFFSHVHAERGRLARAVGCSRVVPRSAFVHELPNILAGG